MNPILIKILIMIAIGTGIAYGIHDYINTKQELAVAESTLESTTAALRDYAQETEKEIEGWKQAATILSAKFQAADEVASDERKLLTKADFDKLIKAHPDMLARRINAGTARMFGDLEAISRGTGIPGTTKSPETKTP